MSSSAPQTGASEQRPRVTGLGVSPSPDLTNVVKSKRQLELDEFYREWHEEIYPRNKTKTKTKTKQLSGEARHEPPDFVEEATFDRPEATLRRAVETDDVFRVQNILMDLVRRHSANSQYDYGRLLRLGLLRSADLGKPQTARFFLDLGAETAALPSRESPLSRAAHTGRVDVLTLLLQYGADVNERDRNGTTALMIAALRNYYGALSVLLSLGADVNAQDKDGKSVLHLLAADRACLWGGDVVEIILRNHVEMGLKDSIGRTALHWACATGKRDLAKLLLVGHRTQQADIHLTEALQRTSLHLAIAHGRTDVVHLLLEFGAKVDAKSAGGWTPLHIACQRAKFSHEDSGMVQPLIANGADVNTQTTTGETPLHLAAESGVGSVLECLLACPNIKLNVRDDYGNTPYSKAVKAKAKAAIHLLAPFHSERLSREALEASHSFTSTIVDFGDYPNGKRRLDQTIYDLLYKPNQRTVYSPVHRQHTDLQLIPGSRVSPIPEDATHFRWINLPSNNIAWVEALLTKAFLEDGDYDVEKFMAVERSLETLQRGQRFESHYMRPFCETTSRGLIRRMPKFDIPIAPPTRNPSPPAPPSIVVSTVNLSGQSAQSFTRKEHSSRRKDQRLHSAPQTTPAQNPSKESRSRSRHQRPQPSSSMPSSTDEIEKFKSKRHRKAPRVPSPSFDPRIDANAQKVRLQPETRARAPLPNTQVPVTQNQNGQGLGGSIFLAMPYVHFEIDLAVSSMERTIKQAISVNPESTQMLLSTSYLYEEVVNHQRPHSSAQHFDIRALSFYRKVDAGDGGIAQVKEGKSQASISKDQKNISLYMVGQLWMWIFSQELIITCLPQQWNPAEDHHLNVLEGIIKDIKNKSKETAPVKSVVDLASIISARCIATFDSRVIKGKDYPFLDKFESIVSATDQQVDELFRVFNSDSREASEWLKRRGGSKKSVQGSDIESDTTDEDASAEPEGVNRLLDINPETSQLGQIQGLRDEFQLLTTVLSNQSVLINDLMNRTKVEGEDKAELKGFVTTQLATIQTHMRDIERMEHRTDAIYASITNLLDLKHRYANVFEARFARYQATDTVHQGQTIMVFTIVTVIFLPLSFISTLFTINISDFPQGEGGEPSMSLAYVAKWVFGIGFAISVPLVVLAMSYESMMRLIRDKRKSLGQKRRVNHPKHKRRKPAPEEEVDWKHVDGKGHGSLKLDFIRPKFAHRKTTTPIEEV